MYETYREPLLPRRAFVRRVLRYLLVSLGIIVLALCIGILGYRFWVGLSWLDALLNASMILGGMGPVNAIASASGKLFASFYALFSGVAFLGAAGVLFAPVVHRLLHRFHLDKV